MADAEQPQDVAPKKRSKKPLIIGAVLALLLGAGGFYASFSGLILAPSEGHATDEVAALPEWSKRSADPSRRRENSGAMPASLRQNRRTPSR